MRSKVEQFFIESIQPRPRRGGWHGGPTPMGAVRGVSVEEASWVPAPGRHSIWALMLHIAYWKYAVRRRLEGGDGARFARSPANWPRVPDNADPQRWRDDIALLEDEHERLLDVVRGVPLSQYGRALPKGKRWTKGELITGIAMHDAYHTGQIVMLKRLYAATNGAPLKR